MNPENFFDFYSIIVNEIIGGVILTTIIGIFLLTILGIKSKMPLEVIIIFNMLWLLIIFSQTTIYVVYAYTVLFVGALFYFMMKNVVRN